jgi:amino acid permease
MDALPLLKNDTIVPPSPPSDTRRTSSTNFPLRSSLFAAKATESGTLFQLLCTMCGTGILQLPYTVKQGGWATLAIVALVGAMANWSGKLLIKSLYLDPDSHRRIEGFPEIGYKAYGMPGYVAVQLFHKATLFGVSTIFLVLTAKFLLEGLGGEGEGEKTACCKRYTGGGEV